jgi:hypothetical protein
VRTGGDLRLFRRDVHDEPVVGALDGGLVAAGQHLGAEVRQDHAAGADPVEMTGQGSVVDVISDRVLERVRLAHEEVGISSGVHQSLAPLGVTRVGDSAPGPLDTQRVGRRAARVLDRESGDSHRPDGGGRPCLDLDELGVKTAVRAG